MMSLDAATLQTYIQEFVKCSAHLKQKHQELKELILANKDEKTKLEGEILEKQTQLDKVNKVIEERTKLFQDYEEMLQDSEAGFKKILESSQLLLTLVKQKTASLDEINCES